MTTFAVIRKLFDVATHLQEWQAAHAGATEGRCLEAVRAACAKVGLKLPLSDKDYAGKFAITCGETLADDPAKWGWDLVCAGAEGMPTDRPTLVFFRDCGTIASGPNKGKQAGHVAIFKPSTAHIVANTTYNWSKSWADKVAYVFVPIA